MRCKLELVKVLGVGSSLGSLLCMPAPAPPMRMLFRETVAPA